MVLVKNTKQEVVTLLEYHGINYSDALVDAITDKIKSSVKFSLDHRTVYSDDDILHGVYRVVGTHYGDFTAVVENVYKFIKEIK